MLSVDRLLLETAHKIRDAVRKKESFDTAQIQVIGLTDIRHAAAGDWPTIAERIRKKSMIFIETALRPGDIVVPCGDGFLIIYAERAAERDLALECTALQDKLNAFYLGEEGFKLSPGDALLYPRAELREAIASQAQAQRLAAIA